MSGLRREEVEHVLSTAFQDGFGCANDPKYHNRTVEHTDRLMAMADEAELKIRDSERNHIFSVMRSLGIKFDQKAVMKLHKEWEASAAAELARKKAIAAGEVKPELPRL